MTWSDLVGEVHARLVRVGPGADPGLLRERGLALDPLGEFRFRRPAAEILGSGLATGCDDYAKVFLELARAAGIDGAMVWAASERELEDQLPGRTLQVEGRPLVLDPLHPVRLVSGHQFAAVREGGRRVLVDPSFALQGAIPFEGALETPAGLRIGWDEIEAYWPVHAAKIRERGREGDGLVVRRIGADPEAGNSVAKLMKIYASGDPGAVTLEFRLL